MLTQCPKCHTLFRITEDQLHAALGRAHCGKCEHIFNAVANLREEPPVNYSKQGVSTSMVLDDAKFAALANSTNKAFDLAATSKSTAIAGLNLDRLVWGDPNVFNTEDAPSASDAEDADSPIIASMDDLFESLQPRQAVVASVREPAEPKPEEVPSQKDDLLENIARSFATRIEIPETERQPAPEPQAPAEKKVEEAESALVYSLHVESPLSKEPAHNETVHQLSENAISDILTEDLADEGSSIWRSLAWAAASILLFVVLAGQYLFWNRDALAQRADVRPYIVQTCEQLGCAVPLYRDPKKIIVLDRMLTLHPQENKFLVLNALIKNEGAFVQTFPSLELRFEDLAGNTVRLRRFKPEEYLSDLAKQDIAHGFGVNQQVRVKLEFLDPGLESSDYQIEFL